MFRRAHYEYLSNKILDDTKFSIATRKHIFDILGSYFEDDFVNFDLIAEDPNGDDLEASVISGPSNGELNISGLSATYTPDSNYFGSDQFTFTVTDGEWTSSSATVSITVLGVNDVPTADAFTLEVESDVESTVAILESTCGGENGGDCNNSTGTQASHAFTGIDDDSNVSVSVKILQVDMSNGGEGVDHIYIGGQDFGSCFPDPRPSSDYDCTFYQCPNVNDVDISSLITNGQIDVTVHTVQTAADCVIDNGEIHPEYDYDTGQTYSGGYLVSLYAEVTLTSTSASTAVVDFDDYVNDDDGDELSIVTIPPSSTETLNTMFGGTLEPTDNLEYEYTPPAGDYPSDFILFKADDGQAQSNMAFGTFNLNGGRWSRFFPPTAFDDNISIPEDNMYYVNFVGFDVFYPFSGDETVTITRQPEHGTLGALTQLETGTQQLAQWIASYTPDADFSGSDLIKYIVTNPNNTNGSSAEATISITITPLNDLPVIEYISSVSMDEDSDYSFTINYSDVDDDLSASASSNSADVVVSISSGSESAEITIDPADDYFGTSSVTVTVTESDGEASISSTFMVTVNPVNDAPVITSSPASTDVEIGTTFSYQVTASDIDDIVFSYGISNAPDGMTLSDAGLVEWTPETHGSFGPITLSVSDGEASDTQDFNVTSYFIDCAGVTNGNNLVDNCGDCDDDASNDCVQGCDGAWGSGLIDDECGICGGDNTSCADCAGTPNGSAVVDNCGTCDADASNDCVQDCAGAWGGEISNCLESVELIDPDKNKVIKLSKSEIDFSYRSSSFKNGSILLSALFHMDYSDKKIIEDSSKIAQFGRKDTQPLKYRSAGSVFKNPSKENPAGMLIDKAGLKGLTIGGAQISEKHANFFINKENAKANDMLMLIKKAKNMVKEKFDVDMNLEVKLMGFEEGEIDSL